LLGFRTPVPRKCRHGGLDELELQYTGRRPLVIIRVFRARIHPGKEDEFERFVRETGVSMLQAQAGCSHVAWGRSRWSDQPEFAVVTHWDSVQALEAFAGPRWREAVIEPEEEHMLAEVFCDHYETVATR
jgi:quinol monooxygenase YgiN